MRGGVGRCRTRVPHLSQFHIRGVNCVSPWTPRAEVGGFSSRRWTDTARGWLTHCLTASRTRLIDMHLNAEVGSRCKAQHTKITVSALFMQIGNVCNWHRAMHSCYSLCVSLQEHTTANPACQLPMQNKYAGWILICAYIKIKNIVSYNFFLSHVMSHWRATNRGVGVLLQVPLDTPLPQSPSPTRSEAEQAGVAHICSLWGLQTLRMVLIFYSTLAN